MTTIKCDRCGRIIKPEERSYVLPTIRFDLGGGKYGPNRWCYTIKKSDVIAEQQEAAGPLFSMEFLTDGLDFCQECIFDAFATAVEKMRSECKAKLKETNKP